MIAWAGLLRFRRDGARGTPPWPPARSRWPLGT